MLIFISDHTEMNLDITTNKKKKTGKFMNIQKLNLTEPLGQKGI